MELVVETDGGEPSPALESAGVSKGEHREQVLAGVYRDKVVVLRRVARGLTGDAGVAEELVQDAFIRTLGARRAPEDPDELFFYLVRVVTNVSRSHLAKATRRAARRRSTHLDEDPGSTSGSTPGSSLGDGGGDGPGDLADAVARLPQRQREVVFLRYWLDLGVDQTARTMGISAGAVKTHASRALGQLRGQLDGLPDELPDDSEDDQP